MLIRNRLALIVVASTTFLERNPINRTMEGRGRRRDEGRKLVGQEGRRGKKGEGREGERKRKYLSVSPISFSFHIS